uniref:Chloroplast sensor kinase n=1 Tax=Kalanchoe fedtschenkoi TaxID=63787 RepID=A0A7N0VGE8_KALFE
MLLSAFHPQSNSHSAASFFFLSPQSQSHPKPHAVTSPKSTNPQFAAASAIASGASPSHPQPNLQPTRKAKRFPDDENGGEMVASAAAVAAAIRRASTSPVEFAQRVESEQKSGSLVLPSADFQRLCVEQMDLFRRIVDCDALISVYVRPAGSYVMDRLELRRVAVHPSLDTAEIVILIGNFSIPSGLRVAEAALSNQQAEVIPECRSVVFPMVKHPFVVGFLVAEIPALETEHQVNEAVRSLSQYVVPQPPISGKKILDVKAPKDEPLSSYNFLTEQRLNAINITRSIAMAYVLDQKAMLLQQSSWQNNVRMSNLVEQIRGPLSSIRTLSKMLSVHLKRSEVAYDIAEDILVQGDVMRDSLQQLQDAVYLTKSNIVRYNEETLKKIHGSSYGNPHTSRSQLSDDSAKDPSRPRTLSFNQSLSLSSAKDLEMPMPPLALAPLKQQEGVRKTVQCFGYSDGSGRCC